MFQAISIVAVPGSYSGIGHCFTLKLSLGTFNIGRKDRLWKNYHRLRLKFGKEEFSFLPRTFCLPADTKLLRRVWEKRGCRAKWIVKPPALARGTGITVINKWSQVFLEQFYNISPNIGLRRKEVVFAPLTQRPRVRILVRLC